MSIFISCECQNIRVKFMILFYPFSYVVRLKSSFGEMSNAVEIHLSSSFMA